jgi:hypothetical protein
VQGHEGERKGYQTGFATDRMLPSGSLNQAILLPCGVPKFDFALKRAAQ